ncbi:MULTISPECIES: helix-turn-helix domain-containing protein [unclassified Roseitalea]|uniref:helix-turn-helix domain-containing protein n=1 Tax=unclassified Roseitalea TaxID=2639107 RepID=UPI00273E925F|nr:MULTISPECIES: helix-turn-helix domain-containing protein [unclassified Roseitalea]
MHRLDDMIAHRFRRLMPEAVVDDAGELDWNGRDWRGPDRRPLSQEETAALCDGVIDLMAALFSVCGRQLRSPERSGKPVARVRQIGMYIAHVTLGLRMVDVAAGFGRNKSTVVYACHLIEDLRDDEEFDMIVAMAERVARIAFSIPPVLGASNER